MKSLLHFVHDVSYNMNAKCQTTAVYLDFQKAFDFVSLKLLIKKLTQFEISLNVIELLNSYLSDRTQSVVVNNVPVHSAIVNVTSVVCQGSLIGPLLFIAYVSDLPSVLECSCCSMYADDIKAYRAIKTLQTLYFYSMI